MCVFLDISAPGETPEAFFHLINGCPGEQTVFPASGLDRTIYYGTLANLRVPNTVYNHAASHMLTEIRMSSPTSAARNGFPGVVHYQTILATATVGISSHLEI